MCRCCGEQVETLEHVLFFCQSADMTGKVASIKWNGIKDLRKNFWLSWNELMEATKKEEGNEHICLIGNLLWQVWKTRNEGQFWGVKRHPMVDTNKAMHEWEEYR